MTQKERTSNSEVKRTPAVLTEVFLPPVHVSNDELAKHLTELGVKTGTGLEVTGERISKTTGIDGHYYLQPLGQDAEPQELTIPEMAVNIASQTILNRKWSPNTISHIMFCSSYPVGRKVSRQIAREIGALNSQTLDVYAACSGFTYALKEIKNRAKTGDRVLIVAAEHYSAKMADDLNRSIFSDGAATFAFENNVDFKIISYSYNKEPSNAIRMPINDFLVPLGLLPEGSICDKIPKSQKVFEMEGSRVLEWAVRETPFQQTLKAFEAARQISDTIVIIPHQGSGRLVRLYTQNLVAAGVNAPISSETVNKIGNLAAASIPAELHAHLSSKNTKNGDVLILAGFGAGLITSVVTLQSLRDLPKAA